MKRMITFGSRQIDLTLEYGKIKSLHIKVHPNRTIEVTAPMNATEEDIMTKVKKRAPWILKQIDHFGTYLPATPPRRFISGETHLYLGRQYRLKII